MAAMAVTVKKIMAVSVKIENLQMELQKLLSEKQCVLDNAKTYSDYPGENRIKPLQDQVNIILDAGFGLHWAVKALTGYR